ncbi:B3 domain-containing protein REM16-like isoform X1 [Gastrolobium bilobum]|uniref:B3 domain-containing protein REM16-like isoform X1 n=1 Tax=Gastrolobium bilobum TaxID=150636 RepID=UPI002AB1F5D7|nr:B3 domain-containing protein REM16-like isoform X1 [Gastrolobium bilobum]
MGEKNCDSCRSWVDEIYWTHFQFLQFAQFLRGSYDQQLALPKTFSDNLKKKLPGNVTLRGPGGIVWNIGLMTRDDTLYFTNGWQQFVKDHSLKENDFLVFKYNGESLFDVLIFDGESYCEKAASYFVRKCGHAEDWGGCFSKRRDVDNSLKEVNTPSNAGVECAYPKKYVSWVEDIYWTHFQFLHFTQFLGPGYVQCLALPKTFSHNLKKKLPENVALRGPGGVVWNIGLTTRDDTLYFTQGWQQFVKDHSLKENDFLVFKYNGDSLFDVLIFDGQSCCEKAASYFVRKIGHAEDEGGCSTKKRNTDNSLEEDGEKTYTGGVESACPEEVEVMADVVTDPPAATPLKTTGKRTKKLVSAIKHVQTKRRGKTPKASTSLEGALNWVTEADSASVGKIGTSELYTSNRRPITEDEKKNALELAQAASSNDGFYVVMRPTHVYKRFFLSIPNKWMNEHFSPRSQDVILRIMGKAEWIVKYTYIANRRNGGLTGGWKHFVLDNNLEEFDVCVFKLGGQLNNTMILEVDIFRVVEEIAPLTAVNSPRGRKKLT